MSKLLTVSQAQDIANGVIAKVKNKGYAVASELGSLAGKSAVAKEDLTTDLKNEIEGKLDSASLPVYTVTKQATAENGFSATYQLFKDSVAVGDKINIPKDMVVESGTVETVETADTPYEGAAVGDKYIDLVIANKASSHIYIPVTDLIDIYTGGNGIDVTSNAIAIVIDSTNANGLSVGANGLALATATTTAAGAMSAADKVKLDGADVTAYTSGNGINIANHSVTAVVDGNNGLSVGSNGIALATVVASTDGAGGSNGAMTAAQAEKLADIEIAEAADINAVISALDNL